jgi:hypothetical protein
MEINKMVITDKLPIQAPIQPTRYISHRTTPEQDPNLPNWVDEGRDGKCVTKGYRGPDTVISDDKAAILRRTTNDN